MGWCAVVGCHNGSSKNKEKTFFLMPTNRSTSSAWKRAINRTELPKQVFVCSDHFEESCFNIHETLNMRNIITLQKYFKGMRHACR